MTKFKCKLDQCDSIIAWESAKHVGSVGFQVSENDGGTLSTAVFINPEDRPDLVPALAEPIKAGDKVRVLDASTVWEVLFVGESRALLRGESGESSRLIENLTKVEE